MVFLGPTVDYTYLTCSKLVIQPPLKYLGIQINAYLSTYESFNVTPIITHMETRLHTWASLPLNLTESCCVNIFKMICLPKFLYVFCASLFFLLKKKTLKKIRLDSVHLPLAEGTTRYCKASLQVAKADGGLACPNLRHNFLASQLTYVYELFLQTSTSPFTTLLTSFYGSRASTVNALHRSIPKHCSHCSTIEVGCLTWHEGNRALTIPGGFSKHPRVGKSLFLRAPG